jgi:tetratricopeptide (TPR) repeat protein
LPYFVNPAIALALDQHCTRPRGPLDAPAAFAHGSVGALISLSNSLISLARRGDYPTALKYAEQSLRTNADNLDARQLSAVLSRLRGDGTTAEADRLAALVPLSHLARFERYLVHKDEQHRRAFVEGIRNEMPHETYLELAAWYHDLNRPEDARQVLEWAARQTATWRPKYYLALILWSRGELDRARDLLRSCGTSPDYAPFYVARAKAFEPVSPEDALADLRRAAELDPREWRFGKALAERHIRDGAIVPALEVAQRYTLAFPENYILGMLHARALLLNARVGEAAAVLDHLNVLPFEGSTDGRTLYREAQLLLGAEAFRAGDLEAAARGGWPPHANGRSTWAQASRIRRTWTSASKTGWPHSAWNGPGSPARPACCLSASQPRRGPAAPSADCSRRRRSLFWGDATMLHGHSMSGRHCRQTLGLAPGAAASLKASRRSGPPTRYRTRNSGR